MSSALRASVVTKMEEELLKSLQDLRDSFAAMELPKSREEFENRAMLNQFLNYLIIKQIRIIK